MNIETQFNINDQVWLIHFDTVKEWIPCGGCSGTGKVFLDDQSIASCPKCHRRGGTTEYKQQEWQVRRQLTIGHVRVQITNIQPNGMFANIGHYDADAPTEREEQYMCYETGVGSGTLWKAEDLFAGQLEAQAECEKRNAAAIHETASVNARDAGTSAAP